MKNPGGLEPCRECDKALQEGIIKEQRCGDCKVTEALWPGNHEAWFYIARMLPGLISDNGVNYQAIKFVFDVYNIPKEEWQSLFEKALVVANAILEKRTEELNARQNRVRVGS